jgi:hypothetical protein
VEGGEIKLAMGPARVALGAPPGWGVFVAHQFNGSEPGRALEDVYVQLTEVEAVFRALKSDLAIRPIGHWSSHRVEAHVMVAFLGYCLWVCLKQKLKAAGPALSP